MDDDLWIKNLFDSEIQGLVNLGFTVSCTVFHVYHLEVKHMYVCIGYSKGKEKKRKTGKKANILAPQHVTPPVHQSSHVPGNIFIGQHSMPHCCNEIRNKK